MSNATAPEMARKVLHIDSSCRTTGSASREVSAALVSKFNAAGHTVVSRDLLVTPPSVVDDVWITANFSPPDTRSAEQVRLCFPNPGTLFTAPVECTTCDVCRSCQY